MATKSLKTRIQNKHDTEANWAKATTFRPLAGELIIYDEDSNNAKPRFKIGDGSRTINNLPFVAIDYDSRITSIENTVDGLGTAAQKDVGFFATAAQGTKADNAVPNTRKVNNKALSTDIKLEPSDVGVTESAFPGLKKTGTITGIKMNGASKGTSGVVDLGTVLTSSDNLAKLDTENTFTAKQTINSGYGTVSLKTQGYVEIGASYAHKSTIGGLFGFKDDGTGRIYAIMPRDLGFVERIKMNSSSIEPGDTGTVDLGTVITAHQDISGLMPKSGGTFTGEVKFGNTENFQGYYIKRMIGSLGAGTAYGALSSSYKDGTWHRMWRLRFPSDSDFWGKIKITLYGGYSSFNASGVMSKSITCNFNTSNIYNNVGCYDGLGVNVEQDFRISEAIWNADASAWEVLIWQKNLSGNNSPTIMLECWTTNNTNYINAFNGIAAQTVELTQSTSYSAQRASSTGGTKTVEWATLPVYENPLGEEIATVAILEDKQDKITSSNKLSASLVSGLATVATSGSYNDLSNKPTIPAAVTESTVSGWGFTKNKDTVTSVAVKMNGAEKGKVTSSGTIDLGTVITAHQDISGLMPKSAFSLSGTTLTITV